jgi:hypothetical protein
MLRDVCRLGGCSALALVVVGACGGDPESNELYDGGTAPDVHDAGQGSLDGAFRGDVVEEPIDCPRCSSDLHTVVGCDGKVAKTCPSDLGCFDNDCIPACEAAAKSQSNMGCEYYSVEPEAGIPGRCFAAFVTNPWNAPMAITVERNGTTFDTKSFAYIPSGRGLSLKYDPLPDGELPPGAIAILFLSGDGSCPQGIHPAFLGPKMEGATRVDTAFHITTSLPAVAYDIYPYAEGGAR